jgi:hypothetical protein
VERCKIIFEFLEFILFYCVVLLYFAWSTWSSSGAMLVEVLSVYRVKGVKLAAERVGLRSGQRSRRSTVFQVVGTEL